MKMFKLILPLALAFLSLPALGDDRACPPGNVRNGIDKTLPCQPISPMADVEDTVLFEADAATLDEAALTAIKDQAGVLLAFPDLAATVTGYTAPDEPPALALARAEAVRDQLVANGVPSGRINVIASRTPAVLATGDKAAAARAMRRAWTWTRP